MLSKPWITDYFLIKHRRCLWISRVLIFIMWTAAVDVLQGQKGGEKITKKVVCRNPFTLLLLFKSHMLYFVIACHVIELLYRYNYSFVVKNETHMKHLGLTSGLLLWYILLYGFIFRRTILLSCSFFIFFVLLFYDAWCSLLGHCWLTQFPVSPLWATYDFLPFWPSLNLSLTKSFLHLPHFNPAFFPCSLSHYYCMHMAL